MNIFGFILVLALMLSGLIFMFGGRKTAGKIIITVIVLALFLPLFFQYLHAKLAVAPLWSVVIISALIVIISLFLFRKKSHIVFGLIAVCFRLSHLIGNRLVEFITRFPPAILPQPEKIIVAAGSIVFAPFIVVAVILVSTDAESGWYYFLIAPLGTVIVVLIGKYRYLKRERRGLANV